MVSASKFVETESSSALMSAMTATRSASTVALLTVKHLKVVLCAIMSPQKCLAILCRIVTSIKLSL